jgi:hypothetical protein
MQKCFVVVVVVVVVVETGIKLPSKRNVETEEQ